MSCTVICGIVPGAPHGQLLDGPGCERVQIGFSALDGSSLTWASASKGIDQLGRGVRLTAINGRLCEPADHRRPSSSQAIRDMPAMPPVGPRKSCDTLRVEAFQARHQVLQVCGCVGPLGLQATGLLG